MVDEPDLDRIIRFHDPVAHRSHAPRIGVWVDEVRQAGQPVHDHPLLRARVELLDSAVYEGRNDRIVEGREPIVPWHLRIEGGGIVIDAFDPIILADVERRRPLYFDEPVDAPELRGVANASNYRAARAVAVRAELEGETIGLRRQALQCRLLQLEMAEPSKRESTMFLNAKYDFYVGGPNSLVDPNQALGTNVITGWRVTFWMGGWDADGLCGYVKGTLSLP
jgi:hypothetical protein